MLAKKYFDFSNVRWFWIKTTVELLRGSAETFLPIPIRSHIYKSDAGVN